MAHEYSPSGLTEAQNHLQIKNENGTNTFLKPDPAKKDRIRTDLQP